MRASALTDRSARFQAIRSRGRATRPGADRRGRIHRLRNSASRCCGRQRGRPGLPRRPCTPAICRRALQYCQSQPGPVLVDGGRNGVGHRSPACTQLRIARLTLLRVCCHEQQSIAGRINDDWPGCGVLDRLFRLLDPREYPVTLTLAWKNDCSMPERCGARRGRARTGALPGVSA